MGRILIAVASTWQLLFSSSASFSVFSTSSSTNRDLLTTVYVQVNWIFWPTFGNKWQERLWHGFSLFQFFYEKHSSKCKAAFQIENIDLNGLYCSGLLVYSPFIQSPCVKCFRRSDAVNSVSHCAASPVDHKLIFFRALFCLECSRHAFWSEQIGSGRFWLSNQQPKWSVTCNPKVAESGLNQNSLSGYQWSVWTSGWS